MSSPLCPGVLLLASFFDTLRSPSRAEEICVRNNERVLNAGIYPLAISEEGLNFSSLRKQK